MAEQHQDEPVLALKVTKVIWILVAVVIFLAYTVLGFTEKIEHVLHKSSMDSISTVDKELDDTNDLYESSLDLILKNNCPLAVEQHHKLYHTDGAR